jgi:hypothetical protein
MPVALCCATIAATRRSMTGSVCQLESCVGMADLSRETQTQREARSEQQEASCSELREQILSHLLEMHRNKSKQVYAIKS